MTNKKAKILFYISTIREGGAARVMVNLANQFTQMGYPVVFVTNFPSNLEYPLNANIQRFSLEQAESTQNLWTKNISRIKALRTIIGTHQPAYCITFMMQNNVRLLLSTLFTRTKSIISIRTDPKKKYRGFKGYIIGKLLYRLADGIVFQTKEAQRFFPQAIQRKSAVIFNPVAESFYQTERVAHPQHLVTCSRLSKEKRHDLFIRAFSHIAPKFPTENLLIYGEGKEKETLLSLITALGLQNRIFLMGQSADVAKALAQAKLFVLSSDYEGMPNALMEALAMGVPSIATDCPCGGPRELIKQGENGLLVPCNDENALAKAMDTLLSQPGRTSQISANARRAAQGYHPYPIACQWETFLHKDLSC